MKLSIARQMLNLTHHISEDEYCYRTLHSELTRMIKMKECKAFDNSEIVFDKGSLKPNPKNDKYRVTYKFFDGSQLFRESIHSIRRFPS